MLWLDLGEYRGPSRFHVFVSFCVARTRQRDVDMSYRRYVTDTLQNIPQSRYLQQRWSDLIKPRERIDVNDTIDHVIKGLGLEVGQ